MHDNTSATAKKKYDKYSWVENRTRTLTFITSPIGIGIWVVASLAQSGLLKLRGIQRLHFAASLETIAAVFGLVSFCSMLCALYFTHKRQKNSSNDKKTLLSPPNQLVKKAFYIECAGIVILTVMQIAIAIDLWSNNLIGGAHKKIGLQFDIQTIVDTIGLSMIFLASLLYKYDKYQTFKEKNNNKDNEGKLTVGQKAIFALLITIPFIGAALNITGKILIGFEGSKQLIIPLANGGRFPLAMTLRMIGVSILLCFAVYEIGTQLNEPVIDSSLGLGAVAL